MRFICWAAFWECSIRWSRAEPEEGRTKHRLWWRLTPWLGEEEWRGDLQRKCLFTKSLQCWHEAEGYQQQEVERRCQSTTGSSSTAHVPNYYSYVEADASRSSADASITRYESSTSHTQQSSSRNNKRERIRRYQLQRRLLFIGRHTKTNNYTTNENINTYINRVACHIATKSHQAITTSHRTSHTTTPDITPLATHNNIKRHFRSHTSPSTK